MFARTQVAVGADQLDLSVICLGGNVFGWTLDRDESFAVLDVYADLNGNFIDTADCYSAWADGNRGGESETILGEWIRRRGNREDLVIATKLGYPGSANNPNGRLTKKAIRRGIEGSLRRLQSTYVDLLYAHRDDPQTELSETLETFDALVREGKARSIAASNYSSSRLRDALRLSSDRGLVAFSAVQPRFNLIDRGELTALQGVLGERRLAVFAHSALAGGFLTGKYSPGERPHGERDGDVRQYMTDRGFSAVDLLKRIAKKHSTHPASVALAWAARHRNISCVIASATSMPAVHDLARGGSLRLTDRERSLLDAA